MIGVVGKVNFVIMVSKFVYGVIECGEWLYVVFDVVDIEDWLVCWSEFYCFCYCLFSLRGKNKCFVSFFNYFSCEC